MEAWLSRHVALMCGVSLWYHTLYVIVIDFSAHAHVQNASSINFKRQTLFSAGFHSRQTQGRQQVMATSPLHVLRSSHSTQTP